MVEGRERAEWGRTAGLLAMLANCSRDPKKTRAFKPADFDPYAARDKRDEAIEVNDMGVLKDAFVKFSTGKEAKLCERQSV